MKPQPVTWRTGPPPAEAIAAFVALFGVTVCPAGRAAGLDDDDEAEPAGRMGAEARSNRPGRRPHDGALRTASGRKVRTRFAGNLLAVTGTPTAQQRIADLLRLHPLGNDARAGWCISPACGSQIGRLALAGAISTRQRAAGDAIGASWRVMTGRAGPGFPGRSRWQPDPSGCGVQINEADPVALRTGNDEDDGWDPDDDMPDIRRQDARVLFIAAETAVIAALGRPAWHTIEAVALDLGPTPRCATLRLLRRALDVADLAMNPTVYGPGLCDDDTDGALIHTIYRGTRSGAGGSAGAHV